MTAGHYKEKIMTFKERFGSTALITGASSGIGKAFARALAAEKVNLILAARRIDELKKLKQELEKEFSVEVSCVKLDLAQDGFIELIDKTPGSENIDILVNNAGYGTSGYFCDIDSDTEQAMVKVNCIAPLVLTHRYLPAMVKKRKGALVFLSSIAANQPAPLSISYAATKVFDQYLGEALHSELKGSGVAVLTVQPGPTYTGFQQVADYNEIKGSRSPEDVVRSAMKALGKRPVVVDGCMNKVMTVLARIVPRTMAIELAKRWAQTYRKKE